ncbi:glycosyltransferase [Candidatus Binatus sp.]|uniref:glycosyltransferase n=1 Tax=Candidatus Binatus sp. TaxID=2811406 RepID=UPI003C94F746
MEIPGHISPPPSFRTGAHSRVRVSVVVPIFNSAKTIARTLESILSQDFADGTEIIAVDDGSTDATARELSRFSSHLKIISQENRGVAAAENAGVVAARGEYIAFCDADDVWMPDKLGATVAALDRNRDAVLAYSDCIPVADDGVPLAPSLVPPELAHAPSMRELLRGWWPIVPSAAVIRRDAYWASGGQCTELRSYHDVYLWMLLRELGPFEYVARPLVRYRKTTVAERTLRDECYYDAFVRQVRARYHNSADGLLRATRHGCANLLGYRGLLEMRSGNLRDARRSFASAVRREPTHLRNAMRLMRTFLPLGLALRLGGRTCRPELAHFPGAAAGESRRIQPQGAPSD